jgi:hypothetical protein
MGWRPQVVRIAAAVVHSWQSKASADGLDIDSDGARVSCVVATAAKAQRVLMHRSEAAPVSPRWWGATHHSTSERVNCGGLRLTATDEASRRPKTDRFGARFATKT